MDEIQKILIKAGRKDLAQKYYLKVSSLLIKATEFPSQEALDKYLKEHPDADRHLHSVETDTKEFEKKKEIAKQYGSPSNLKIYKDDRFESDYRVERHHPTGLIDLLTKLKKKKKDLKTSKKEKIDLEKLQRQPLQEGFPTDINNKPEDF